MSEVAMCLFDSGIDGRWRYGHFERTPPYRTNLRLNRLIAGTPNKGCVDEDLISVAPIGADVLLMHSTCLVVNDARFTLWRGRAEVDCSPERERVALELPLRVTVLERHVGQLAGEAFGLNHDALLDQRSSRPRLRRAEHALHRMPPREFRLTGQGSAPPRSSLGFVVWPIVGGLNLGSDPLEDLVRRVPQTCRRTAR